MKVVDDYYHWDKGENVRIGIHFTTKEFECRCTYKECVHQTLAVLLVQKLDNVRGRSGAPIIITNGFRCAAHQADLIKGGKVETVQHSQHELGRAADLKININGALLELANDFDAIGVAKTWFHVDLRTDKVRHWKYSK